MAKKDYKFVVINKIPVSTAEANDLSTQIAIAQGSEGWELVSVMHIPNSNPTGMLLSFQKDL